MASAGEALRAALANWATRAGTHADDARAQSLLAAAEDLLTRAPDASEAGRAAWHEFLLRTGTPDFLERLDAPARHRWADAAIAAIRRADYTLETMLAQRVAAHPDRVLFSDRREGATPDWSYAQVAWYARSIAGVFLEAGPAPRVALFADNGIDVACADLACLLHGILVAPLNVHLEADTLAWILDRLHLDVVLTDTEERVGLLATVRARLGRDLRVYRAGERAGAVSVRGLDAVPLRPACARVDPAAVAVRLATRRVQSTAPATVMFTSGSTGRPKGIVFSVFNLVAKRFARAAALPAVGRDEVLLCYLPLFHTFGRFLEMLGTVYWGGTYVFAGSPTAEGLIAELGRVRPTGLISVPVRWTQIREQCLERMEGAADPDAERAAFREVVGDRLRWGLSAAGHLDPAVFRFFQRQGVDLCSGFGMTEGTGGITMTPPGAYVDGTVGLPLPGVRVRLGTHGELQFSGPYAARYLDEDGAPGTLPVLDPDEEHWVATGDLFTRHANGYLEIVDRIKDIYKNSRGQTVAPQRVEQRFASVPGIRRTFLAGDHRDHNVLLVVLDHDDPVVAARSPEEVHDYLGQIVASVNQGLAPYERVVRFAVLDRDFELARGELTPKGSMRRKVIAEHFAPVIESLYRGNHVDLDVAGLRVRLPRWFFRDLAILEDDIVAGDGGLRNTRTGVTLAVARAAGGLVRVGDLLYRAGGEALDLGLFARQPRLWLGNPALVAFAPCKPGWEVPLREVADQVRLPAAGSTATPATTTTRPPGDDRLQEAHARVVPALFGDEATSLAAIDELAGLLTRTDEQVASAVRRRLEALAYRPEEEVRARAYRVLLLDEAVADYDKVFGAFLDSGLSFLNEANIAVIARSRHGERRLQALRQRLYRYRTRLEWPGPPARQGQFTRVLGMLADFARHDRESFAAVEAELAAWALFREAPAVARAARRELDRLSTWQEQACLDRLPPAPAEPPADKVVFDYTIPASQRARLRVLLFDRTLLARSLARAFGEEGFTWTRVAPGGVWVSPVLSQHHLQLHRLAINLADGKHFDLLLVTGSQLRRRKAVGETVLWLTALSDHAVGPPALPRFGVWRRDLGVATIAYVSHLTAWERIRELTREADVPEAAAQHWAWQKLYVRAMATFFRAWEHSGYRIVPGALTPSNVSVPDTDFHEGTTILSLAGWRPYEGPAAFVGLLHRNFYRQTEAYHPHSRETLRPAWIFDACLEALGPVTGARVLDDLARDLAAAPADGAPAALAQALAAYRAALDEMPYVPLPVRCAIRRFEQWERVNATASRDAREEAVLQMLHLYRLDRFPEAFRFHLYRHTYFARAGANVHEVFERLVARRLGRPTARHTQLEELSELQNLLADARDREVFSRMVFPQAAREQQLALLEVGPSDERRVVVRSAITDEAGTPYEVREPVTAVEVGQLYRLVLDADYPKRISAEDRHLAIVDAQERIVGGLFYRWQESRAVYVDAIVVSAGLRHRALGGRLLEDFCVRAAAQGARCVKTNFFLGQLFGKHGFRVDQRWGGLVRFLAPEAAGAPPADGGLW